jgi:hypothetical protein
VGNCGTQTPPTPHLQGAAPSWEKKFLWGDIVGQSTRYEARQSGCKSIWCDHCGPVIGRKLRARLLDRVKGWKSPMMLTLTVDPTLFLGGPQEAWQYVQDHRAIGNLVKWLWRSGYLLRRDYFCGLEFQGNDKGGWPHWHLLVDAKFVPFEKLGAAWGRNRSADMGPVQEGRPAFGFVSYTAGGGGSDASKAVNYATKYLCKPPREGLPPWVKSYTGRVHRYSTSHGFWGKPGDMQDLPESDAVGLNGHPLECFCDACRAGVEGDDDEDEEGDEVEKLPARTVDQRLARCGKETDLFKVTESRLAGGDLVTDRDWVGHVPCDLREVVERCGGRVEGELPRAVDVPYSSLLDLMEDERLTEGATWNRSMVDGVAPWFTLAGGNALKPRDLRGQTDVETDHPTGHKKQGRGPLVACSVQPYSEFAAFSGGFTAYPQSCEALGEVDRSTEAATMEGVPTR